MIESSIRQMGLRIASAGFALMACCLLGCQRGPIQVGGPYMEGCHFPPRAYEGDELYIVFERPGDFVDIFYQDVAVLRLILNKVHSQKGDDLFDLTLETLVHPSGKQSQVSYAFNQIDEGDLHRGHLLGVASSVYIWVEQTGYGACRLDQLRISFDPGYVEHVRKMVAGPVQEDGDEWSFVRRAKRGEETVRKLAGYTAYEYTPRQALDLSRERPGLELEVKAVEVFDESVVVSYAEQREYWPVNPMGVGANPFRTKPLRKDAKEQVVEELPATQKNGSTVPLRKADVWYQLILPLGDSSGADPVEGSVVSDGEGRCTIDLTPLARNVMGWKSEEALVEYRASGDRESPRKEIIHRKDLLDWFNKLRSSGE